MQQLHQTYSNTSKTDDKKLCLHGRDDSPNAKTSIACSIKVAIAKKHYFVFVNLIISSMAICPNHIIATFIPTNFWLLEIWELYQREHEWIPTFAMQLSMALSWCSISAEAN